MNVFDFVMHPITNIVSKTVLAAVAGNVVKNNIDIHTIKKATKNINTEIDNLKSSTVKVDDFNKYKTDNDAKVAKLEKEDKENKSRISKLENDMIAVSAVMNTIAKTVGVALTPPTPEKPVETQNVVETPAPEAAADETKENK